ncbi:N-acetylmuramoyl-L-alanine amidase [Aureimonas mangrovi]|uniref:N-acetylmuramoyl-L-alanine amidase n=1 Tax=Aureimonas mangrovi TaxID=2758041 RepID=UPI00163DD2A4|nr:N-acetylmuramoyl-L-alanine amidase [Aureimonas mangrovi]
MSGDIVMPIPASWLPAAVMDRVHLHWTGGALTASVLDRRHYHFIVEGDGNLVRGDLPVTANQKPIRGNYAAHTLGANAGAIGVSLACMAGAQENPFRAGSYPMTEAQWRAGVEIVAELCRRYGIKVSPKTVLTHAEVQATLGIAQRGKWDIARLAFDASVFGAKVVGDRLRRDVSAVLDGKGPSAPKLVEPENGKAPPPKMMEMSGVVTATSLNFRRAPDGEITGSLPRGTAVDILDHDRGWYEVRSPAGYRGFVAARYVALA